MTQVKNRVQNGALETQQHRAGLKKRGNNMISSLLNYVALVGAYVRLNLNAQLEYRGAFISKVLAMFLNDGVWVVFWVVFFERFPVLRGWTVQDVITVWAVMAAGFGLTDAVFGNVNQIARLVAQGQLDVRMLYPRSLLPHMLLGRMNASGWGDALFGVTVYLAFVRPDLERLALFAVLMIAVAALIVGFGVLSGSLAFFLGNAGALAQQWQFAFITFSTYPNVLFDGWIKIVLFTLIPVGFISGLSVEALRSLRLEYGLLTVLGSLAFLALGTLVFYIGLRRYESGNLMEMRG
jgi:ABC-2 type transport system permease protein